MGPMWESVSVLDGGQIGTVPNVGFRPTTPQNPAGIPGSHVELPGAARRRREQDGLGDSFDARERLAGQEAPVGGDRHAARLARGEIRRGVADPDLDARRRERSGSQKEGEDRSPEVCDPRHQILGSTSRLSRADPEIGTGCSTDSA